jgi:co-chaperonin GroES (HSP10)
MSPVSKTDPVDAPAIVRPTGYRVLVRIPRLDAQMRSGLYRPDSSRSLEETASILGEVLAMGENAYCDAEKFPGEPWCRVGDTVMMRAYSGTRFKIDDQEYRLINDDTVEAVVSDPQRIERV